MAQSYMTLRKKIDKLQRQAEAIKEREVQGVIGRIKVAIDHYGLTREQLFGGTKSRAGKSFRGPRSTSGAKLAGKTVPIKYRDGDNTWSGRGNKPRWLVARIAEGKTLEDFLIKTDSSAG